MLSDMLLAALFIASAVFQVSFINSLASPLVFIPFHFIVGTVIMHRAGATAGFIWFIASAFFLSFIGFESGTMLSYLLVAILGVVLTTHVFTNRSVYALEGLGVGLFVVFIIINAFPLIILQLNEMGGGSSGTIGSYVSSKLFGLLFLVIGLYLGFLIARYLKHLSQNIFLIRGR
ncbi:hypothetical protein IH979_02535 [Patescibacteria group bacterium]|nr:hypothetical protein [Patescibacteria group bacterium]